MARPRGLWAGIATILIAIVLVATALNVRPPDEDGNGNEIIPPEKSSEFWKTALPASGHNVSADDVEPVGSIAGALDITGGERQGEVVLNETIKKLSVFRNSPPIGNWGSDLPRFRGHTVDLSVPSGDGPTGVRPLGVLFTDGDIVYILNQERDLMTFNVSSPDGPVAMGQVDLLGTPYGMVLKDGYAFVVSDTDLGYQMNYTGMGWDVSKGAPAYQIRTQLVVVDLTDPSSPKIVRTIGLDGFVASGCIVNDTMLLFGNCYPEYNQHYINTTDDKGRVYVVDVTAPSTSRLSYWLETERTILMAHVASDSMFLVLDHAPGNYSTDTDLEVFSIDGRSVRVVRGTTLTIPGRMSEARWMDGQGDVLRVATRLTPSMSELMIRTMNVSDPSDIRVLSGLQVKGVKEELMVRFDGDVLMLFHGREGGYEETNLTVVGLGHPGDLTVSGSCIIPGRYFWADAFKGWVLATGSFEDFRDYCSMICLVQLDIGGPVLRDSERFAQRRASPPADDFLDATTLLEDDGIVLVPGHWDDMAGTEMSVGTYSFTFSLESGTLTAGERISAPNYDRGRPEAMAPVGDVLACLSAQYLQFIDVGDPVKLIDTVLLVPWVQDVRLVQDRMAWIVRLFPEPDMYLWVGEQRDLVLGRPAVEMRFGGYLGKWYWYGNYLVTYSLTYRSEVRAYVGRFQTIDLSDPSKPLMSEPLDIEIGEPKWSDIEEQNPVLVGGGLLVFLSKEDKGGTIHWIDIRDPTRPTELMSRAINISDPQDMRVYGHTVYITDVEDISNVETVEGRNTLKYTLLVIDVSDPVNSTVSGPINIPGTVVGTSLDGRTIYTHALWAFKTGRAATLNAIDLKDGAASIRWAMDTSTNGIVSNDRLVEVRSRVHYSKWISNGDYETVVTTTFNVYDLSRSDGPRYIGSLEIFGWHPISGLVGDYVLCRQYEAYYGGGGVQVIHIRSDGPPEAIGFYPVPMATYTPINLQEGFILLASDEGGGFVIQVLDT